MESDVEKESITKKRPLYRNWNSSVYLEKKKPAEAGLSNTHLESEISIQFAYCL